MRKRWKKNEKKMRNGIEIGECEMGKRIMNENGKWIT